MLRFNALHASESQSWMLQGDDFCPVAQHGACCTSVTARANSRNCRIHTNT